MRCWGFAKRVIRTGMTIFGISVRRFNFLDLLGGWRIRMDIKLMLSWDFGRKDVVGTWDVSVFESGDTIEIDSFLWQIWIGEQGFIWKTLKGDL